MGAVRTKGRTAWRKYDDPSQPIDGTEHEPDKDEIFDFVDEVEDQINLVAEAGALIFRNTRALLYADLEHDADIRALVQFDATEAYNGYYTKTGASGSGAWTFDGADPRVAAATRAETAAGAAEGFKDEAEAAAANVTALAAQFVLDPDGQLVRQQIADRIFRDAANDRAAAECFLDSVYGDNDNSGATSHLGKASVAGLLPKALITKADIEEVEGYTNVFKIRLDKGPNRPRRAQCAIFRNDLTPNPIAQHFALVMSIGEIDSYMAEEGIPAYYDSEPGARVSDVYFSVFPVGVDGGGNFIGGDPTADAANYYWQMTVASDAVVAVRSDSIFKAGRKFDPQSGFGKLVGIGRGALPVFDCYKALGEGDFEASAHADAAGVVFQTVAPIVAEDLVRYLNDADHNVIMTDPDGLRYPMEIVTSVAACAAKRGTIYLGTPSAVNTNARSRMQGAVLYINPRWGKDPTDQADGTRYEFSYTSMAWSLTGANGATDWTDTAQGQVLEGLVAIGGADGQGVIFNSDTVYRRICVEESGKHALTLLNGRAEDCVLAAVRGGNTNGYIPMEGFATNPAGQDLEYVRLMVISPDHYRTNGQGTYSHGNLPNLLPLRANVDGFVAYNGWSVITANHDALINDALFVAGPIERTATGKVALLASAVSDEPEDRDHATVTDYDSGNAGLHVWRADLATPTYEFVGQSAGTIQANIPTGGNTGVKTTIRRALFNTTGGACLLIPAAGAASDLTSVVDIRDSFLSQRDAYPSDGIQHFADVTLKAVNNIIVLSDNGLKLAYNCLYEFQAGSEFRYNIILDFRTATGGGMPVLYSMPGAGVWDYNVYCFADPAALYAIYVDNVQELVNTPENFAAYKAAVASSGMDAHSIALFGDDWQDLFVGDPRTGDLRLKADSTVAFTDASLVRQTAGIRHYRDWNKWTVLDGQPAYLPKPPTVSADWRAYTRNPPGWNWRNGAMDDWALTF